MKIDARFHCKEIVGTIQSGIYELPDGADVTNLLEAAQKQWGYTLSPEELDYMGFMINGQGADWHTELHDGDLLRVLYRIIGG